MTHGVVYGKAQSGGVSASIQAMLDAYTKTQALFDNCFSISNEPDALDLKIVELDQNLIFQLVFDKNSNNYNFQFNEPDILVNA